MKRNTKEQARTSQAPVALSCDVLNGIKPFASQELQERFGKRVSLLPNEEPESIMLRYSGNLHELLSLRTIVTVYLVEYYPITRPRALLGHQHYQVLLKNISKVRALHLPHTFKGFRISAAGENSSIFTTLRERLSVDLHIPYDADEGDLLLRIRPSSFHRGSWEVLTRLTARPLSTRPWRVYNMKGALNATVAAAMIEIAKPQARDRFFNMMCGSGTLLIECIKRGPVAITAGCDIDREVLAGAQKNVSASSLTHAILLMTTDATSLPFLADTFDVMCADLPWGQLVGSHEQNSELYPKLLIEAARVASPKARLVLLTHEISLFEKVLQAHTHLWKLQEVVKIFQGGLHPRIYVLQRPF